MKRSISTGVEAGRGWGRRCGRTGGGLFRWDSVLRIHTAKAINGISQDQSTTLFLSVVASGVSNESEPSLPLGLRQTAYVADSRRELLTPAMAFRISVSD